MKIITLICVVILFFYLAFYCMSKENKMSKKPFEFFITEPDIVSRYTYKYWSKNKKYKE